MAAVYETSAASFSVTFLEAGEAETVAFDAGSGVNRVLLVCVSWRERGNTISGITYNGVTMTSLGAKVTESGTILSGQLWRLLAPASGSNNLVVTMGASGGGDSAAQISCHVTNGAASVDGYQSGNGNGSTANIVSSLSSAVTSAVGDRVVTFHCTQNVSGNITATPTNYTERQDTADGGGYSTSFGDADGAASVNPSATWSNGAFTVRWVAFGINVVASAETAPVLPRGMQFGRSRRAQKQRRAA